jgi:phytanoyl-CoA hydroxylase
VFDAFSHGPDWAELAGDLGLAAPQLWQSMFIFKQPGIGGEVRWHQDATFLHSEPITVTGFWIALEDASVDNGCLWVAPGGHRGPLRQRFVRDGDRCVS